MHHRFLPWLAWSSVGVTLLCGILMPVLLRANGLPLPANQVMFSLAILAFCTVGALIATRQPTNAIGWIFCALAFVVIGAFSEQAPCLGGTTNDENVADGCDVVDLMDRQRASLVRRSIISWYPESAEQADLGSLRYHKLLLRARTSESF